MNINNPDQQNVLADELSLLDIIEFIQESWKIIAGFTVLGIAGAALYLWAVPQQYEAIAQIKIAQIPNVNNNLNQLGINVEEPQGLIARMALPTSYPKEIIVLCGLTDEKHVDTLLTNKVNLFIPKGVTGTVNLKIRDESKEIAKNCTNAVYQLIKSSQAQLVATYIDEVRKKLVFEQERLSRASQLIAKADKSGAAISATYLATRDEIRYLLDQISNMQNIIAGSEIRATHLSAPIYVNDQPVFPHKGISLLVGLLLGGFLGLILALGRRWYQSNRAAL